MQEWLHPSPNTSVLWLRGPPGTGKSVLASQISLIDEKDSLVKAIDQYSMQRLQALGERTSQINVTFDELRDVASSTALKSDGMFLYARLVLDFIASNIFYSLEEVKGPIASLPKGLSDLWVHRVTGGCGSKLRDYAYLPRFHTFPIQELSFAVDRFNAKTACLSKGLEVFGQHSQVNKSESALRPVLRLILVSYPAYWEPLALAQTRRMTLKIKNCTKDRSQNFCSITRQSYATWLITILYTEFRLKNSSSSKTNSAYRASHVVFAHGLGRKMGSKIPANWNDI
ncbi:hypothetical protein MCOR02_011677 [Pyricularia oryzae]|nr:hypothetical protein MCOR02_011677 [Pyricularia oryzae]KAI6431717.1 hypothetical protein MCOR21_003759 [Pyricularia oryzae]KAI6491661.1 hypothetical protein MCOR18_001960 [Pyricularia oryzae]